LDECAEIDAMFADRDDYESWAAIDGEYVRYGQITGIY
jgi:hypothetical protein